MADATKTVPIQIAEIGSWKGHPSGPFELNARVFSEIVSNFMKDGIPVPIDAEHASEADATSGSIPVNGAPAMGWIHSLENRGDKGLWGMVEWLEPAKSYIKEGRYKFLSPAVRFGSKDRVTGQPAGARLTSAAITNNPWLKSMQPLRASDRDSRATVALMRDGTVATLEQAVEMRAPLAHAPGEYMPTIRGALQLPPLATARDCSDHLGKLREHLDAAGGDHTAAHEGIQLSDFLMPLRSMTGSMPGANWDDILDVVQDLIDAAMDKHEVLQHGELAPDMADDPEDDAGDAAMREETNMDPTTMKLSTDLAEATVALRNSETKAGDAVLKLKDAEGKVAELTLSLKEATAAKEKGETELVELRKRLADRDQRDLTDRVDEAFGTYKDSHKLTDLDKEMMLLVLTNKPEVFEKKYPKVAPDQRHLMRDLTTERDPVLPTTHVKEGDGAPIHLDVATAARKLSAEKGIPLGDAQLIVMRAQRKGPPGFTLPTERSNQR